MSTFLLVLLSATTACGPGSKPCTLGDPVAIFNAQIEGVETHQFSHEGRESVESIQFDNGVRLEILQSGCELVRQEFRFYMPERGPDASEMSLWVQAATNLYFFLGSLDYQFQVFQEWAAAIEQQSERFVRGEALEVYPGFWVEIDPVQTNTETMLRVILSQGQ
jgi:hypothetical protein